MTSNPDNRILMMLFLNRELGLHSKLFRFKD